MPPRKRHPPRRAPRSTPPGGHLPVLLDHVLAVLAPAPGEVVLDATLGLAGHAVALLERVGPTGRLIGLDLDPANLSRAHERLAATGLPFSVHHTNFAAAATVVAQEGLDGVDMLVADLGMSSMQVDDAGRGFSYVRDGPLDMRMDPTRGATASERLATISEADLAQALSEFGDEPAAAVIAHALVRARQRAPLLRTTDVTRVIGEAVGQPVTRDAGWRLHPQKGQWTIHPAARTFQALRILVNRELASLRHLLRTLPTILRPGGRAAVISFHSGEDRLVKAAFNEGLHVGVYAAVAEEPLRASDQERVANPRSRSAKLRWARRATPS
jgi:16S rRNA (cytosine1402-N4)-methyltransferase